MAESKPYKMTINKILQLGIMVENASKMTSQAQKDKLKDVADVLMNGTKSVISKNQLVVVSRTVGKDHPFSFASVHHDLPLPDVVEKVPLVIEVVFKEGVADKLFVRIKDDLDVFDGVTSTHTAFQVLEYMEHGTIDKVSPFPYTGINGGPDSHNSLGRILRFLAQFARLFFGLLPGIPSYLCGKWRRGPLQSIMQDSKGTRVCRRYNKIPESLHFREITAITDGIKTALKLAYYAVTVNFSPTVCISLVPTAAGLKQRDVRLGNLTLPPMGSGPPMPQCAFVAGILFNVLFYNNYGRHDPNISGKITDYLWDWMGIYDTFPTFTHCIEIQGTRFVRWCAHPEEWKQIEATGLLSKLGEGESFTPVPFYSKGE